MVKHELLNAGDEIQLSRQYRVGLHIDMHRTKMVEQGLPDRFVQGVSPSWRCKLVPLARTEDELREHAVRGVPTLASPEYARGVFDAVSKSGGGEDSSGDDALPTRPDAVPRS